MTPRVLYFGRWSAARAGHYLFEADGRTGCLSGSVPFTMAELDSGFCPEGRQVEEQVEGRALLHHLRGWTVLAFWDRSADSRGNSHSTFLAEGTHSFHEMWGLAVEAFPTIRARWRFSVYQCSQGLPVGATEINARSS